MFGNKKLNNSFKRADIPELGDNFSSDTLPEFKRLLEEAHAEGFGKYPSTEWENKFHELFFNGGQIPTNEKIDEAYKKKIVRYFKTLASSREPKHEHKVAVCAYLLRSLS